MYGLDVSEFRTANEKAARLVEAEIECVEQARQFGEPDARVIAGRMSGPELHQLLDETASYQGIKTGDDAAKIRCFWEQPISKRWVWLQSTVDDST